MEVPQKKDIFKISSGVTTSLPSVLVQGAGRWRRSGSPSRGERMKYSNWTSDHSWRAQRRRICTETVTVCVADQAGWEPDRLRLQESLQTAGGGGKQPTARQEAERLNASLVFVLIAETNYSKTSDLFLWLCRQDMEISITELQTILNRIISKRQWPAVDLALREHCEVLEKKRINKLFSEHGLKLERWQGPPHINQVKQFKNVSSFKVSLFKHQSTKTFCCG